MEIQRIRQVGFQKTEYPKIRRFLSVLGSWIYRFRFSFLGLWIYGFRLTVIGLWIDFHFELILNRSGFHFEFLVRFSFGLLLNGFLFRTFVR
ncbi:unnamed protein product [Rhizophagus irregularis]|nr:unnamed protein product [Rhizophagus irregularis]